jgi:uncharacterized protein (TIGR00255 family)
MTGYGMAEKHNGNYDVKVEIRSLNGKYLDLNFRMPRYLLSKEIELRNLVGKKIERGSVTISINIIKHSTNQNEVRINKPLATEYYHKLKSLSDELNAGDHDIFRITALMQDVIYQDDQDIDEELETLLKETAIEAFDRFDKFRLREGESIHNHFKDCCERIAELIPEIEKLEPTRKQETRERLHKNLTALLEDDNYDKNRFEQELIYYIEKFDVSEEKTRLSTHCKHFLEALADQPKGKKLSFISQEMGREINTLGSKANHSGIQKHVIDMKEELEKIKEQVLNVL